MDIKALFLLHSKSLQASMLRKTRDPQLAADLTQESFARLVEQPDSQVPINPAAYLYRTAQNLWIDHLRQQARRNTDLATIEELDEVDGLCPEIEEQVQMQRQVEQLLQVVSVLPSLTQRIFQLNRLEGLTHAEVARHLGISDSSVQKHLSKALAHVMEHIEGVRGI